MKKTGFLLVVVFALLSVSGCRTRNGNVSFTVENKSNVTFYTDEVKENVRLLVISDTHLWQSDSREEPNRKYSARMSKAYNETRHFRTGKQTEPLECLRNIAKYAVENKADAIICMGDMVSYPSEYAVEQMRRILDSTGIGWYYTAGNHDWHYEGMEGSQSFLREKWIGERLVSLYPDGANPLAYSVSVKGVKLLLIDDSTCEITSEQLEFFQKEDDGKMPVLLFMHVPVFAPGTGVGYSIGHPDWNASSDINYQVERREKWPQNGHSEVTYRFRDRLLTSKNLLGVFSGHVHSYSMNCQNGVPYFTVEANCRGGFYDVKIVRNQHIKE